jgi:hypothetical protein
VWQLFLSFCQLMARPSMNVNSAGDVPRQKKKKSCLTLGSCHFSRFFIHRLMAHNENILAPMKKENG